MRRFFGNKKGDKFFVEGEEFVHLRSVLRLAVGDEIVLSLDDEFDYVCQVEKIEKTCAVCALKEKILCEANPKKNVVLFQALAKSQKFDIIVQKATELGVSEIVPFVTEFSVVKPTENKVERLKSIAMNACKQCERSIMPKIANVSTVSDVVGRFGEFDAVLFANERTKDGQPFENLDKCENIAIIVGAEGGFSQKEKDVFVDAGATSISLGKRILRCETASIAMMSLVSVLSGN